jgi:hypothetical protein
MAAMEEQGPLVRRVVLPSGKTIEVVYFDAASVPAGATPDGGELEVPEFVQPKPADQEALELHICPECDSDLVYPVEWEESGRNSWRVSRRCPCCEWVNEGVHTQDAVDLFDERLDDGTEALLRDLKRLAHANMVEEINLFVAALEANAILPEDF